MGLRLCQTGPQGALFISQCPQRCHLSVSIPRRCRGVAASTATVGGREMNAPIQVAVAASGARQAKTTEPPCYCRGLVGTSSFLPLRCSRDHGEARTARDGWALSDDSAITTFMALLIDSRSTTRTQLLQERGGRRTEGIGSWGGPPEFAYPHQRLRFLSVLAFWSCATMIAMQKSSPATGRGYGTSVELLSARHDQADCNRDGAGKSNLGPTLLSKESIGPCLL